MFSFLTHVIHYIKVHPLTHPLGIKDLECQTGWFHTLFQHPYNLRLFENVFQLSLEQSESFVTPFSKFLVSSMEICLLCNVLSGHCVLSQVGPIELICRCLEPTKCKAYTPGFLHTALTLLKKVECRCYRQIIIICLMNINE